MRVVYAAIGLLLSSVPLWAGQPIGPVNIQFIPEDPTLHTPITVHIWGEWSDACVPQFTNFEVQGTEISLYFPAPGRYQFEVR